MLKENSLPRIAQKGEGTSHKKSDLETIREIRDTESEEEVTRKVRALTTNKEEEAAYRVEDGKQVLVRANRLRPRTHREGQGRAPLPQGRGEGRV